MKIKAIVVSRGLGGFFCDDLAAIKAGHAKYDGNFLVGAPVTEGFKAIREPSEVLSVQLLLESDQIALGEGCSVVYAGFGGRDPVFRAEEAERLLLDHLRDDLAEVDVSGFRAAAERIERLWEARGVHTALRCAVSQALLHAAALTRNETMAEVVAAEYGLSIRPARIPICAQCGYDRYNGVDRMILKQVPVLPHGNFTSKENMGSDGGKLIEYASWLRNRVSEFGAPGYRPVFHLDLYGSLGEVFHMDMDAVAACLIRVEEAAQGHRLQIEAPVLGRSREEVIDRMKTLHGALRAAGSRIILVADEFCNTLADIRAFAEAGAADMVQIKMPDLGGITQSIEAVLLCRKLGVRAFLGGSCNETDWSGRLTVHLAQACGADQIYNKPGLSVDEGFMIIHNEQERLLAVLANKQ